MRGAAGGDGHDVTEPCGHVRFAEILPPPSGDCSIGLQRQAMCIDRNGNRVGQIRRNVRLTMHAPAPARQGSICLQQQITVISGRDSQTSVAPVGTAVAPRPEAPQAVICPISSVALELTVEPALFVTTTL